MAGWLRRFVNTLAPRRVEREIERELQFHLEERIDELRAAGVEPVEADRRARHQLGLVSVQAARTREPDVFVWIDARLRDLRHAARALARTPGFTLTVLVTLALGIGANTAVFSVVDAVLLRPLPFPDADQLVQLRQLQDRRAETNVAPVRLDEWQRLGTSFAAISGYYVEDVSDTSAALPERVRRAMVAPRFLEVWGVPPASGRDFVEAEYRVGGPRAVLVSDRYRRTRLGAEAQPLGAVVRVGAASYTVVGVMAPDFLFPDRLVDLWFPTAVDSDYARSRAATWFLGIGRLEAGVTVDRARANLTAVQGELARLHPATDGQLAIDIQPMKDTMVGGAGRSLWVVFAAVSVLLLITCLNVAALWLSRAAHREPELAVRRSLGASRLDVGLQLLTETGLIALVGGVFGMLVAIGATGALRRLASDVPRADEISVEGRILLYTVLITGLVGLLCGLIPALRTVRDRRAGAALDTGRTQVSGGHRTQWLLVGVQTALAVMLLAAAGLLGRSLHALSRVEPGYDASRVLSFRISGHFGESTDYPRLVARIDATLVRLLAVPGVESAATALFLPGLPTDYETTFALVDGGAPDTRLAAESRFVSPEYFATMRVPLVAGAPCARSPLGAAPSLMVNQAFVRAYLPDAAAAVGRQLAGATADVPPGRVAGVVADVRERGLDRLPGPTVYTCFSAPNPVPYFLVRTRAGGEGLAGTVRRAMSELEPLRSVYDIAPLEERIDAAFAQNRLRTWLLGGFALVALLLTCLGIYGTLGYVVGLRRREIGLRLALGAVRREIVGRFVARALWVTSVAGVVGLLLAGASTRLLAGMLYGVSPTDPVVFGLVLLTVLAVATLAALLPAARAARLDPMQVLREG